MKLFKYFLIAGFISFLLGAIPASAQEVDIHFFYGDGCPHCTKEEEFLATLTDQYPEVQINYYETYNDSNNANLLKEVGEQLEADVRGVPVTFINDEYVSGFYDEELTGSQIRQAIDKCLAGECSNQIQEIINNFSGSSNDNLAWYTLGGVAVLVFVSVLLFRKFGK